MFYEAFKNEVCKRVKARLQARSWFRGVCCDSIEQSYQAYLETGVIENAVDAAELDTIYWDAGKA